MPDSDYWATVAQVLPVFALAVVVEARAISQRWTSGTSKLVRYTLSSMWVVTLVVLAFGELAALKALRGQQVSPWWAVLMENAIGVAISVLVFGPAFDLLMKGYAEGFARLMTGGWLPRLRLALLDRRLLRRHREFLAVRQWLWRHLQWHEAMDRTIADQVASLRTMAAEAAEMGESHLKMEVEEKLREVTAVQQDAARGHVDARKMYRQAVVEELERDRVFREDRIVRRRRLAEVRAAERHRVFERSWPIRQ